MSLAVACLAAAPLLMAAANASIDILKANKIRVMRLMAYFEIFEWAVLYRFRLPERRFELKIII